MEKADFRGLGGQAMDKPRQASLTLIATCFGLAYAAWLAFVVASGAGVRLFGWSWNFETVGQLGDAFGGLSAFMASLAALFTLQALSDERAETRRLREREEARDAVESDRDGQQQERVKEERLRDLELTYFRMLDLRREILDDVQIGEMKGLAAFRPLKHGYHNLTEGHQFKARYEAQYVNFDHVLGHYFRFTYHAIKYVDEVFDFERAYAYVRLLRAQLSSSEQFIICVNALFGEGREKMLPLINKYSLLHNMPQEDKARFIGFGEGLEPTAFERQVEGAGAAVA